MGFAFDFELGASWPKIARADVEAAAAFWEGVVRESLPLATTNNGLKTGGIRVSCSGVPLAGGLNAQCSISEMRTPAECGVKGLMPKSAKLRLCVKKVDKLKHDGRLEAVLRHELGHALGIGVLWRSLGLVRGIGTSGLYLGPAATRRYSEMTGAQQKGVPVDIEAKTPANVHWSETFFENELMTTRTEVNSQLSAVTIASLEDLGYVVDYGRAASDFRLRERKPDNALRSLILFGLVGWLVPDAWLDP